MENTFWPAFFIGSALPLLLALVCLITAAMAFVRQGELGSAAMSGGLGFTALAVVFAIRVFVTYLQMSAIANHRTMAELTSQFALFGFGGGILEIAGLVLVAIAIFQRRPAGP